MGDSAPDDVIQASVAGQVMDRGVAAAASQALVNASAVPLEQAGAIERREHRPDPLAVGRLLAESGYFDDAKEASQAAVKVLVGQELGFGPLASMMGVYIVEGKPSLSGAMLAARVKESGKYRYQITEYAADRVVVAFYERDPATGEWVEQFPHVDWTIQMASAANLTGKFNWKSYPRKMLFWRCMSEGCDLHTPDLFGGSPVYTLDELGVQVDEHDRPLAALPASAPAPARPQAGQRPQPQGRPAAQQQVKTMTAPQRRKFFALCETAGIKDSEATIRALLEWVTGEASTERVAREKVNDLFAAVGDHEATIATLIDHAAAGDERARAIVTRYMPDTALTAPPEPDPGDAQIGFDDPAAGA